MKENISKRLTLMMIILFAASFVFSGCSTTDDAPVSETPGATSGEQPAKETTLIIAYERDAETLNHIKTGWYSDYCRS